VDGPVGLEEALLDDVIDIDFQPEAMPEARADPAGERPPAPVVQAGEGLLVAVPGSFDQGPGVRRLAIRVSSAIPALVVHG
jgi:hypothetical protein